MLASLAGRGALLGAWDDDPLTAGALRTVVDRGFVPTDPDPAGAAAAGPPSLGMSASIPPDPSLVAVLTQRTRSSLTTLEREIATVSGPDLVAFIQEDALELKRLLTDPESSSAWRAALDATAWLNERMESWLGETNVANTLTLSAPGNVTSEMGLALLDVADVVRPHPQVVAFLEAVDDDGFLDRVADVEGGPQARDALRDYLDRYGMRCVGEIDITRPRWDERPSTLLPLLLANVRTFEPGEGRRRFARGEHEAQAMEADLLERLRALPDGDAKARETAEMIARVRTFIGYREFPKYGMVCRYAIWKRALLVEARRLVAAGVLAVEEDLFHLTLDEVAEALRTGAIDDELIARRAAAFATFAGLTPPRVMTSDGEILTGTYGHEDVPAGALPGVAVCRGTVEGRARVVLDLADADLRPGDVLVTAYTDPSWSPLFVAAAGLVTEVGGVMTHGAVVAREYGLPAVVGVERATALIRDGQRIRVHGTDGYVELLD